MMVIVKFLLLLSAAGVAVLRFVSYKYDTTLSPETMHIMTVISIICAAVCLTCAAIWIIQVKIAEKKTSSQKSEEE